MKAISSKNLKGLDILQIKKKYDQLFLIYGEDDQKAYFE